MKKSLSFILAIAMVITVLFVPIGVTVFAADGYATRYSFSFSEGDIYNYNSLVLGQEAAGMLTFAPASGGADVSFAPLYGPTNYLNKWSGPVAEHTTVNVDGADKDALRFLAQNDAFFVPVKSDGKPFELEPGHTYTVNIAYTHTGNATNDSWYGGRGLYIGGGIYTANSNSLKIARGFAKVDAFGGAKASLPFGTKVDDLLDIDSTGLIEKTLSFTTPAAQGDGYTYSAQRNSYTTDVEVTSASGSGTVGEKISTEFFNYLYFYVDHYGSSEINIVSLTITADHHAADWDELIEGKYTFDFSNMKSYADVPNKPGQSVIDSNIDWNYAPVSIDAGHGRGVRDIYPVYSNASTMNWGPQTWGTPATIEYDGETIETYRIANLNPSVFVPLKDDGTPYELVPGHSYKVKLTYYMNSYQSGSPFLQCDVGIPSDGFVKMNYQSMRLDTALTSVRVGWIYDEVGQKVDKEFSIYMPDKDSADFTYNASQNTYVKNIDGKDYTLYNYLYFSLTNYGKPVIDFISLEITRDDYQQKGMVEYIDADGSLLKSAESNTGEHAINFVPKNREDKYFAGWYYDADYQNKVTTATVSVPAEGTKLYAKWDEYKTSITSTDNGKFYGLCYVPSISAAGVYSHQMSNRSNVSLTSLVTNKGYLGLSTTFWGDGILLTAVDDTTAELFRAKPNTTYKISLKFRITAETVRADGVDVNIAAGAGLPDTNSNYPMGKYYDENSLKARSSFTSYTDGVTADGEFMEYAAVYTTGEFTTIPAIGVELWIYEGAAVEIYSLSVSEFDGETLSDGEFLVTKEAENNTTYMINFDYALSAAPNGDIGIGFKTTAADTIGYPTFIEGKDKAIFTVKSDKTVGEWYTATVLLTTDMSANVVNSYGYDDVLTSLNSNLYGYVIGDEAGKLAVKNVTVTALYDKAGNDLVNTVGGQCLTAEAEAIAASQAIRYSFTYDTKTGGEIFIGDNEYKVIERGFIYVNGNNYAKGGIYKGDFNLTNAKNGAYKYNSKNNNLDVCWTYSAIENTDLYSLAFSTFVKDFDIDDTKEMMVKAYIIIEIDGQQFTVYSDSINRSVAYLKSLG